MLIHNKLFFDQPVKNKQEAYGIVLEISRNNDDTTGNLLITHTAKTIINSLESIYQDKQIQAFFNKIISLGNWNGCSPVNLLHIFRTPFS